MKKVILNNQKTILKVIATPIGNISEISQRAINALNDSEIIFCEDTRVTKKLLSLLKIFFSNKELISFNKINENKKLDLAIEKIFFKKTVLVSDAGYPCISDPGYILINECYKKNIGVEIINGPSSLIHSAVVSGMDLSNFLFIGFLNRNRNQRINKLKELENINYPIIFFESVHRINQCLNDILEIFGDREICLCRELTKINETIYKGKISEIINNIEEKGEFVIVVNKPINNVLYKSKEECIKTALNLINKGIKLKDACKESIKNTDFKSSDIYKEVLKGNINE